MTKQIAAKGLLAILSSIIVFHLLVITGVIPYQIVWGGRLQNVNQMLKFEAVSLLLNLVMVTWVALSLGRIQLKVNENVLRIGFWIMFLLFLLNTVGNLLSNNGLEKIIFTPLTALLALFSFRLAIKS
ncbi:MAG TPA: hypothetical protein DIS90_05715 [Cytophagales bacterium]|nr:hypothetical protein [Cytophagales bacterium]